jgi:hypothetical protein
MPQELFSDGHAAAMAARCDPLEEIVGTDLDAILQRFQQRFDLYTSSVSGT